MTSDFNRHRLLYQGHLLSHGPVRLPDGRYRARVTITALSSDCTIAQRFLDLGFHDDEDSAADEARRAGMAWVDEQATMRSSMT